jgi:hypothetical protein
MARTVELAESVFVRCPVFHVKRKNGGLPIDPALDGLRIRVHQDLVRIAAMATRGIPGAMDPESVPLPGPDARHIAVPAKRSGFRKVHAPFVAVGIEEA